MVTASENERLTQVSAGTPMGELLRRYWHPIAATSEINEIAIKAVRIMGENLVLYRDRGGKYGLVDRHCPHRRADLSKGWVEQCGIRCAYHGWKFDNDGSCLEQPYEEVVNPNGKFRSNIRTKSYPVCDHAGLLWVYMGPNPAPLLPNWEPFTWKNGFVQVHYADVPCNWLQCQENSADPVHFEWMHANLEAGKSGEPDKFVPKHILIDGEEFEFGVIYRRMRDDTDKNDPLWQIGRVALHPNCFFTGGVHFEWRVPVDDHNTFSIVWAFKKVPTEREPYVQESIPYWKGEVFEPGTGEFIMTHVLNQDIAAWVGQGVIADRTKEHLGQSDKPVVLLRKKLKADLARIEAGEEPSGLIREPAKNVCVELPLIGRDKFRDGMSEEDMQEHYARIGQSFPPEYYLQAGQPHHVEELYEAAMGRKVAKRRSISYVAP